MTLIITITVPDEGETATLLARKDDLGAMNALPRLDFTELIEAATNMLADIIANPPNIPAPMPPAPYTPPPKFDLNAEVEKLLPQVLEAVREWDFGKFKITTKNMAAYLKIMPMPSEKAVEAALKKLVEEKALKAQKYGQFGPPDPPPPPELFDLLDENPEPSEAEAEVSSDEQEDGDADDRTDSADE